MTRIKKIISGTFAGIFLSAMVHVVLAGSLYYGLVFRDPDQVVAELDLSMVSLVPILPNLGGGHGAKPAEIWTLPAKGISSAPQLSSILETKKEVIQQENRATVCSECPSTENGSGWGGGTGEGEGAYVPAYRTAKKPMWIKNFISSFDYPLVAREEGKDGRVILIVLIDEKGQVRDVQLAQGSYDVLNEVALRKMRKAIFLPAYNNEHQPIACKAVIPIQFELR